MRNLRETAFVVAVVLLLITLGSAFAAAQSATVLTNKGGIATGTLAGISDLLRLNAPDLVELIGPAVQYDIPIESIRQITFDFPRVVIDTIYGVLIGPYSAFSGIGEILTLTRPEGDLDLHVTALRAIALNRNGLRPVPREWLGDRFLSEPEILAAAPIESAEACEDCGISVPVPSPTASTEETPLWEFEPVTPVETEETGELPWWIGILGVVAIVVVLYLLTSSGGSGT